MGSQHVDLEVNWNAPASEFIHAQCEVMENCILARHDIPRGTIIYEGQSLISMSYATGNHEAQTKHDRLVLSNLDVKQNSHVENANK